MLYFDTSYLVRLYLEDAGFEQVRSLAATENIACSFHGEVECIAAFHRTYREKHLTQGAYHDLLDQLSSDTRAGAFSWLPAGKEIAAKLEKVYRRASQDLFLRSGDALHLACAKENGFTQIYSHDKRMLEAAALFGLKGHNIIR